MAKAKKPAAKKAKSQVVEHDDDELTPQLMERLKQRLLDERAQVQARLERHVAEAVTDTDNLPDEIDLASRHADQAYLLRLADKERKLLAEIDHALVKFERGTYGLCEGTGEYIEVRRLEIRPWTRYSMAHKEKLEANKRSRAR